MDSARFEYAQEVLAQLALVRHLLRSETIQASWKRLEWMVVDSEEVAVEVVRLVSLELKRELQEAHLDIFSVSLAFFYILVQVLTRAPVPC